MDGMVNEKGTIKIGKMWGKNEKFLRTSCVTRAEEEKQNYKIGFARSQTSFSPPSFFLFLPPLFWIWGFFVCVVLHSYS